MKLLKIAEDMEIWYPNDYAVKDAYGTDLWVNNKYHGVDILDYIDVKDKLLVDVGAYVGWFSFWAIKQGVSKVIAFEPNQENYKCLLNNVIGLELFNIKVFPVALWHSSKRIRLTNEGPKSSVDYTLVVQEDNAMGLMFDDLKLKGQDLVVKMDIEGSEYTALSGMENTIKNNNVEFIVCVYHMERQCKEVKDILTELHGNKKIVFDEVGEINGNTALLICKRKKAGK